MMDTARDKAVRLLRANLCSVGVVSNDDVARVVDLIIDAAVEKTLESEELERHLRAVRRTGFGPDK